MKKLLAIFVSVMLLCGMLPLGAITAAAEELPTIEVGVDTTVTITKAVSGRTCCLSPPSRAIMNSAPMVTGTPTAIF